MPCPPPAPHATRRPTRSLRCSPSEMGFHSSPTGAGRRHSLNSISSLIIRSSGTASLRETTRSATRGCGVQLDVTSAVRDPASNPNGEGTSAYRGACMQVEEPQGPRFEAALKLFLDGVEALTVNGVEFQIDADGVLECAVSSTWQIENITTRTAERDLRRGMAMLRHLTESVPSFADRVSGRRVRQVLVHDHGTGSVEVCRREAGTLTWTNP